MNETVPCVICGERTEILWKMKFNPGLEAAFPGQGQACESGLCPYCDSGGAHAFPQFDSVYEIVNLKTGEIVWKEGQKWGKKD